MTPAFFSILLLKTMRVLPSVLPARPQEARIEEIASSGVTLSRSAVTVSVIVPGKYDILSCHFRKGSQNFSTRCLIDMKGSVFSEAAALSIPLSALEGSGRESRTRQQKAALIVFTSERLLPTFQRRLRSLPSFLEWRKPSIFQSVLLL